MSTSQDGLDPAGSMLRRIALLATAILAIAAMGATMASNAAAKEQVGFFIEGEESESEEATPQFKAETYPAYLNSDTTTHTWKFESGTIECPIEFSDEFFGPFSEASSSLSLSTFVYYGSCSNTYESAIQILALGCEDEFDVLNAGPPYVGQYGKCPQEGAGPYTFVLYEGLCNIEILPQSGLEEVSYTNVGKGAERAVEFEINVTGLSYEITGFPFFCGELGKHEDGTYSGTMTLKAFDEE